MKMKKMNYKVNFTKSEIKAFYKIESEQRMKKLMSLYSYMISLSSEDYTLKISFSQLMKRYNSGHAHYKMALTTIKDSVKTLQKIGLIKIIKVENKINVYGFYRHKFKEKYKIKKYNKKSKVYMRNINVKNLQSDNQTDNTTDIKPSESMINTGIEDIEILHNDLKSNYNYKELESNSISDFDYDQYLKSLDSDLSLAKVLRIGRMMLKELRVKEQWIKTKLIVNLSMYYKNITAKHLYAYIAKAIENISNEYRIKRNKCFRHQHIQRNKQKNIPFFNYEQRKYSEEYLENLEQKLLGWV